MSLYAQVKVDLKPEESWVILKVSEPGLTVKEKATVLNCLMSSMRYDSPSLKICAQLMTNLFLIFLPEAITEMTHCKSISISTTPILPSDLLSCLGVGAKTAVKLPFKLPRKPTTAAQFDTSIIHAYAALSSVLFCLGKEITEENKTAIIENRPGAVLKRHQVPQDEILVQPGKDDGPSFEFLGKVYQAMNVYAEPRGVMVRSLVSILTDNNYFGPGMDMVMTNFKLLRGAQLTHVSAIQDVLQSHPWLLKIDFLRPYILEYVSELQEYAKVPVEFRPFVRLLGSGHNVLFPAQKLGPLIAVAIEFKKDVEKTLESYKGNWVKHKDLVDKVKALAPLFTMKAGVDNLAKMLNLPDVEAPVAPRTQGTPEEESEEED